MIHLLEIGPEHSPAEVKKLLRRYAMTGGVELSLKPDLDEAQLETIVQNFTAELEKQPLGSAERRASSAYRILELACRNPRLMAPTRASIDSLLKLG